MTSVVLIADRAHLVHLAEWHIHKRNYDALTIIQRWIKTKAPYMIFSKVRGERWADFPQTIDELQAIVKRLVTDSDVQYGLWSNHLTLDSPADAMLRRHVYDLPVYLAPTEFFAREARLRNAARRSRLRALR